MGVYRQIFAPVGDTAQIDRVGKCFCISSVMSSSLGYNAVNPLHSMLGSHLGSYACLRAGGQLTQPVFHQPEQNLCTGSLGILGIIALVRNSSALVLICLLGQTASPARALHHAIHAAVNTARLTTFGGNAERRYNWLRKRLKSREEVWAILPESWRVPQLLCLMFCQVLKESMPCLCCYLEFCNCAPWHGALWSKGCLVILRS